MDQTTAPVLTRAEQCAKLQRAVAMVFPGAKVTTNHECNEATPLAVTVHFPNGGRRVARAGSVRVNLDQFIKEAIAAISAWYDRVYGGSTLDA